MRASTTSFNIKSFIIGGLSIAAVAMLIVSWLATAVNASSIVQVTSNIADVPGGDSLVLTVGTQNDGDVYELEIDHSFSHLYPEFSVYADEADPYGGDGATFASVGVVVTYNAAANQWVIDFGDTVTQDIGTDVTFYFAIRDIDGNYLWGNMSPPSPDNTFSLDLENGTGDSLVPEVVEEDEEVVVPGVPNTALGR